MPKIKGRSSAAPEVDTHRTSFCEHQLTKVVLATTQLLDTLPTYFVDSLSKGRIIGVSLVFLILF